MRRISSSTWRQMTHCWRRRSMWPWKVAGRRRGHTVMLASRGGAGRRGHGCRRPEKRRLGWPVERWRRVPLAREKTRGGGAQGKGRAGTDDCLVTEGRRRPGACSHPVMRPGSKEELGGVGWPAGRHGDGVFRSRAEGGEEEGRALPRGRWRRGRACCRRRAGAGGEAAAPGRARQGVETVAGDGTRAAAGGA